MYSMRTKFPVVSSLHEWHIGTANSREPHQNMHRRRMEREAKAKVVASVWGAEFIQFLAALAVFLGRKRRTS